MTLNSESSKSTSTVWLSRVVIPLVLIAGGLWFVLRPSPVVVDERTVNEAVAPDVKTEDAAVTADLEPAPAIGHPAPEFTLKTLDGGAVSLSDLRGQPVIVNFWATWCAPCRLEMPHLQDSYAAHQNEGLIVLGVNLTNEDRLEDLPDFIEEFGLTFPIVLDETGDTKKLYNLFGQPASVFIDRNGIITEFWQGPINQELIEDRLANIL